MDCCYSKSKISGFYSGWQSHQDRKDYSWSKLPPLGNTAETALWHIPMAWYRGLMVVGWWSTRISASNSHDACGFRRGDTITIPFRMEERLIWKAETPQKKSSARLSGEEIFFSGWLHPEGSWGISQTLTHAHKRAKQVQFSRQQCYAKVAKVEFSRNFWGHLTQKHLCSCSTENFLALLHISNTIPHCLGSHCSSLAPVT